MSLRSPLNSYRQVALQTAAPGQLVLMLFEGAIRFLDRAENGFSIEDPAESNTVIHSNIQRTIDIVNELNVALDLENGGELARTLRGLYEYMDRRLVESDIKKDTTGLHEVRRLISRLRDAWAEMLQGRTVSNGVPELVAA